MGILNRLFGKRPDASPVPSSLLTATSNWPYPVHEVAGNAALAMIDRLSREANGDRVPVLLGAPDELAMLCDTMTQEQSPEGILAIAKSLSIDRVLQRLRSLCDEGEGIEVGDWPDDPGPPMTMTGHLTSLRHKPLPKAIITTLPTGNAYEAPAYLKYGGWNSCPETEYHVSLHRHWHERYGATIVTMTHDVIECRVKRRPTTRDEAIVLAWEQCFYAPDIVTQGTETIAPLAAGLMNSDVWFFWWD